MEEGSMLHFVTGNEGKLMEMRSLLGPHGIDLRQLKKDFVEIQADSLDEVVIFGIDHMVSRGFGGITFFKEDAGLFIRELGGFPGVYSAYCQRTIGNRGVLRLMEGLTDRSAIFRAVIGLYRPSGEVTLFHGECPGRISSSEQGRSGFGYDPIFTPEGGEATFAEMGEGGKNRISHRMRAAVKLKDHLIGTCE